MVHATQYRRPADPARFKYFSSARSSDLFGKILPFREYSPPVYLTQTLAKAEDRLKSSTYCCRGPKFDVTTVFN